MALVTPAQFGRALNFTNLLRFPTWRDGQNQSEFPNALGLVSILQTEISTSPSFGEPFLDSILTIRTTLGADLGL